MKHLLLPVLACVTAIAFAGVDQSAPLVASRATITSEFAVAQAALKNAKSAAEIDAANQKVADVAAKALTLRDNVMQANSDLIRVLSSSPFAGSRDRSATIKATYEKLNNLNNGLRALSFNATAPYQPKDINSLQILLDRVKAALDEYRHGAQNAETELQHRR